MRNISSCFKRPILLLSLGGLWLFGAILGMRMLLAYANAPGASGSTPAQWPASSSIRREIHHTALLVFAHPKCPCTRATIEGLAWVMARAEGRIQAKVIFFLPSGFAEAWVRTDLWNSARSIPGVTVSIDESGAEARRFGAETSGYTLVFDPGGRLLFKGGLTPSRGHSGDSVGRNSIPDLLIRPPEKVLETPVFGCPLFAEDSDCAQQVPLCQQH